MDLRKLAVVKGVKNYGKNVAGGARIVGSAAVKPLKWAGGQIAKEMKMNAAKDERYRAEAEAYRQKYPR